MEHFPSINKTFQILEKRNRLMLNDHYLLENIKDDPSLIEYTIPMSIDDIKRYNIPDEYYLNLFEKSRYLPEVVMDLSEQCQAMYNTFGYYKNPLTRKEYAIVKFDNQRYLFEGNDFIAKANFNDMTAHVLFVMRKLILNGKLKTNSTLFKKLKEMIECYLPEYIDVHIGDLIH